MPPFNPLCDPYDPAFIIARNQANTVIPCHTRYEAIINELPTSDPHVVGRPWNNNGLVNISNG